MSQKEIIGKKYINADFYIDIQNQAPMFLSFVLVQYL